MAPAGRAVTLDVRVERGAASTSFERGTVVRVGRGRSSDVRVGHDAVQGRSTVSRAHLEIGWDGGRWSTLNVSDKAGLLHVYEPGYEEVPLEPGRPWVPMRHRWAYRLGVADQPFHVVCETDDHRSGEPVVDGAVAGEGAPDEDATLAVELVAMPLLTDLERAVLVAYYGEFATLPRPATLEPRSHAAAAHHLARSRDSTRKGIERVNEKVGRVRGAPAAAAGRTISAEIGRWLARAGLLDPG